MAREKLSGELAGLTERFQLFILVAEQSKTEAPAETSSNGKLEELIATLVTTTAHTPKSDFRLPRIELPKFGGDIDKWNDFKERYEAMVHNNSRLQSVEKMHYLKSCLVGEALNSIKNLTLTQYDEAWQLMIRRYQNNKVLTFNELKKLMSLPSASEFSGDLKKLVDQLKVIRFNLGALDINIKEWNALFVFIMSQRLPKESFEMWEQSLIRKDEVPEFDLLDSFVENRIQTLLATEKRSGKMIGVHAATVAPPQHSVRDTPTRIASSPPSRAPQRCVFCAQSHINFKCPRLLTLSSSQRKQLLLDHRLCELCLNSHSTESCAYKWRCRICRGKHNTMIHMDPLVANFGTDGSRVLLATALIKVTGDNGRSRTLRALIDQ